MKPLIKAALQSAILSTQKSDGKRGKSAGIIIGENKLHEAVRCFPNIES